MKNKILTLVRTGEGFVLFNSRIADTIDFNGRRIARGELIPKETQSGSSSRSCSSS